MFMFMFMFMSCNLYYLYFISNSAVFRGILNTEFNEKKTYSEKIPIFARLQKPTSLDTLLVGIYATYRNEQTHYSDCKDWTKNKALIDWTILHSELREV